MRRSRWALLGFYGTAIVAVALLVLHRGWTHCGEGDPQGCGIGRAFEDLATWAAALFIGGLALLHLAPWRPLRVATGVLLGLTSLVVGAVVLGTVANNLAKAGTIDGYVDLPAIDTPAGRLRDDLRCSVAMHAMARTSPDFPGMAKIVAWYDGKVAAGRKGLGDAELAGLRREEEARLRYPRVENQVTNNCLAWADAVRF